MQAALAGERLEHQPHERRGRRDVRLEEGRRRDEEGRAERRLLDVARSRHALRLPADEVRPGAVVEVEHQALGLVLRPRAGRAAAPRGSGRRARPPASRPPPSRRGWCGRSRGGRRPTSWAPDAVTLAAASASRSANAIRFARSAWTGHSSTRTTSLVPRAKCPITRPSGPASKTKAAFCRKPHGMPSSATGMPDRGRDARSVLPHRLPEQHVERRRLAPELLRVGDVLPGAAAARAGVAAARYDTVGRRLGDRCDLAQHAAPDGLPPPHVHALARHAAGHQQPHFGDVRGRRAGAVHAGERDELLGRRASGG